MNQRAISFTAFCTVGQKRSEDVEHHIRRAQVWCQHNGYDLELYAELPDGTPPLRQGAPCLGGLYLIQYQLGRGLIKPGTALIVEVLSGVPRDELPKAVTLLQELVESGMVVVTLVDNKVWNTQALSGLAGFMASVVLTYSMSTNSGPGLGGGGV